ncbi:MAG: NifU N-terminal domain-containing protein [Acidimicrobiales bacterium]
MEQDAVRRLVVERNLVAVAFGHLTEAFMTLPFESLGPVKTLLKRYFSTSPWSAEDDEALAVAVGPGEGWWERDLDGDLSIAFGWDGGRFRVEVDSRAEEASRPPAADPLDATFDGPVVPEATPNPRTIRFGFGHPVHDGPSRWYESATSAADDPPVARLFHEFDQVANVLVGPDFVGRRPPPVGRMGGAPRSDPVRRHGRVRRFGAGERPAGGHGRGRWATMAFRPASAGGRRSAADPAGAGVAGPGGAPTR